jgi:glycosyltransferase involved in cell wall biosynthesis
MLYSFIIPAHNEEFQLGGALKSVHAAARAASLPYEIVVVDDASTDRTAEIAKTAGARVVPVHLRKISAVRNAGARAAKGEAFLFMDADTRVTAEVVQAAETALRAGAVGGGAWVRFNDPINPFIRVLLPTFNIFYMGIMGWAAGCFVFAERRAFEAVGGFDESLYATEEIFLSRALKKRGRFVIVRPSVLTSSRKLKMYSMWSIVPLFLKFLRYGPGLMHQRRGLDWWYEGKREKDANSSGT